MIRTGLAKLQFYAASGGALCLRLRCGASGVGDLNLVSRFAGGNCCCTMSGCMSDIEEAD